MQKVIFICLMFAVAGLSNAQEKAPSKTPYLRVLGMQVEEVYDHLKYFLLDKDYFVQNMDSKQAFVQVKVIK